MDTVEVLKIAEADLRRRLAETKPQADAQVEQALAAAEREIARREGEALYWDAEYQFWHQLIGEEVERRRFNEGYEPVQVDLYARRAKSGPAFIGETQIGHVRFKVTGDWSFDSEGKKILRIQVLKLQ